ncbi:hypothetical protein B296_00034324, partial [Ensete ventricosum]
MSGTYRSDRLPVRGPPATGRFRQKSTIDDRFRPSTIDFDRRRSISTVRGRLKKKSTVGGRLREKSTVGDRLRKKKGRRIGKEKKKEGKKEYLARAPSSPACRCRPQVARSRDRFFSHARRRSVSPCRETDRGN